MATTSRDLQTVGRRGGPARRRGRTGRWLVAGLGVGLAAAAWAEGFRSPTIGAAGLGSTGGRRVFVEDASAAVHNPANLTRLERWEASFEPTLAYHSVRFEGPLGGAKTQNPWKFLPHLFAGGPVIDEVAAAGLAVTVPYGLSIDWGDGGALQSWAPHYVELQSFDVSPVLAVKLCPRLTVAAGMDVMWSELEFRQMGGALGLPLSEVRGKGDGVGWSGNFALSWNPVGSHRLAVTVRVPMDVAYTGDIGMNNVPGVPGGAVVAPLKTSFAFPTIIGAGYGLEVCPRLKLEADVEWLQFSRFDTLELQTPLALPPAFQTQRHDWRDTITVGVGGVYDLGGGWHLRLSYQFFQTPTRGATFTPAIPDADQHVVSVGIGYRKGRHRFEAAYAPVFYEDRTIAANQNPAVVGRYEFNVHLLSVAYGCSF
ncbi:MAG: hypothetical protein D6766_14420 [Verrucomicrobia bacterium]|nr:MAG: hypothetical protein D6766_14420 [Verrucomicrobiota bacterium]